MSTPTNTVDQVMEQAQVFASAWSLVGGPFDEGDLLETANDEEATLRSLVAALAATPPQQATPANHWADLWYFVMDEAPLAFEEIVTTHSPARWLSEAHKLMREKYPYIEPAASPIAAAQPDERAAFEAWVKNDGGDVDTFRSGHHYRSSEVNNAWNGWKARAALATRGA